MLNIIMQQYDEPFFIVIITISLKLFTSSVVILT
jgi:hypothetical protein